MLINIALTIFDIHHPSVNLKTSYGINKIFVQKSAIALNILVEIILKILKSA